MAGSFSIPDNFPYDAGGRYGAPVVWNPATSHVLLRRAYNIVEGAAGAPGYADAVSWPPKGNKTFGQVSVGTSAVQLLAANAARIHATIRNNGSSVVYLGKDNTVTTANGLPLNPGDVYEDDSSTDAWFAISAASGVDVRTLEIA